MIFLHYITNNLGDRRSCPKSYFNEWRHLASVHMYREHEPIEESDGPIIVGGGGILIEGTVPYLEWLISLKRPTVFWGGGTNCHGPFYAPETLSSFDLVGIRDFDKGYPYLPCASCMHKAFDNPPAPMHDMMVYSHYNDMIELPSPIKAHNYDLEMRDAVAALASARTIITNSYHGVFWGMLLHRRVLLYKPQSNRFDFFKYAPERCTDDDWAAKVEGPPSAPADYLEECRQITSDFHAKVIQLCAS